MRSSVARWCLVVASILLTTSLVSCGSTPDTSGVSVSAMVGRIEGMTYMRGRVIATTPVEARVTVTPVDETPGQQVTIDTASDGSFSLDLPEGAYVLAGTRINPAGGGNLTPDKVLVHSGQTINVELYVNYP